MTSARILVRLAPLAAALAALALAACGTAKNAPLNAALRGIASGVSGAVGGGDAASGVDAQLTRAALDRATRPLLLAELASRDARATFVIVGQNRAHVTWIGADGIGLILKDGILTGTRGLGADLQTVDLSAAEAALRRGSGSATRVHRSLDGENRVVASSFACRYSSDGTVAIEIVERRFNTRQVTENCEGGGTAFQNRYWIGTADGFVWKSQQWIGPELGTVVLTHLVR